MTSIPYGFFRAAAASIPLRVGAAAFNAEIIVRTARTAAEEDVRLLVLPELCVTGYSCGDLFHQDTLLKSAEKALGDILSGTENLDTVIVIGFPAAAGNGLFNCAAAIQRGLILGVVPKIHLPNYAEFYEERWFSSGASAPAGSITLAGKTVPFGTDLLFRADGDDGAAFGIEICEDLWAPAPPSTRLALEGALVICNPSASNETVGKHAYRRDLVRQQSGRCAAGYIYAGAGVHESTTDLVFGGSALIAENGTMLAEGRRFSRDGEIVVRDIDLEKLKNERRRLSAFTDIRGGRGGADGSRAFRSAGFSLPPKPLKKLHRGVDPHPFVPADPRLRDERCEEIFAIQTAGLAKRMEHTRCRTAVIGVSGGLDSTLALLVIVKTFDLIGAAREGILAVTMPGFGTTDQTYDNAVELMRTLGVTMREIDIRPACLRHFEDIGHDPEVHDTTYENVQARERTQILMDLANKHGGMVIGTGDLSELALGWCTYNGDHMSMYGVNASIPKTLVRYLVAWAADNVADAAAKKVLQAVLDTPISPELLPPDTSGRIRQKTEDILGPYEVHDFFLYQFFRYGAPPDKILFLARKAFDGKYDEKTLKSWLRVFLRRFFGQQFKRSCMPDGPKVGSVSLSPRGDWRMPSDADAAAWLADAGE